MKIKKLLPVMLTVALVAVIGVGATLAYFTDKDDATNVFTMGNVDVDLTEPNFDTEDGEADKTISNVMPGQTITKDPTITLGEDSLDAYIRVKLDVTGFENVENGDAYIADIIDGLDINEEDWYEVDGYYYFKNILTNAEENANVATLFTEVKIPTSWNNDVADVTFEIVVSVDAVQADNLAEDFFNEDGSWNITAEEILAYEGEEE